MIDSLYSLVQKIGFTDPLHAPITNIPIGLVIGAFLFFAVAIIFGKKNLLTTARHVSILAFLFVFPTILFGVFDWLHYFKGALIQPIKIKMILASAVLVLLAVGIIIGGETKIHAAPMLAVYGLAFLCVVGLGWYGARLVYGDWQPAPVTAESTAPAAAAGSTAAGSATAASAASAAVTRGQKLFNGNCNSCHPRGGNVVEASLPLKTSKKLATLATFVAFVRTPSMPNGSAGSMPAFPADQISDAQVGDLYGYITSMVPSWK
jgi:mono/diheme cytochrome c family protein